MLLFLVIKQIILHNVYILELANWYRKGKH